MANVLGRVLDERELDAPRGPDGAFEVEVPEAWLAARARVRVVLPRRVRCSGCHGGGCDACGRSGAVETRGEADAADEVELDLPCEARGAVVRLPGHGGLSREGLGRGHLFLTVRAALAPSGSVRVVATVPAAPPRGLGPIVVAAAVVAIAAALAAWLAR